MTTIDNRKRVNVALFFIISICCILLLGTQTVYAGSGEVPIYNVERDSTIEPSTIQFGTGSGGGNDSTFNGLILKDKTRPKKVTNGAVTTTYYPELFGYAKKFTLSDDADVTLYCEGTRVSAGISTRFQRFSQTGTGDDYYRKYCGYEYSKFSQIFITPKADGTYHLQKGTYYVYLYSNNEQEFANGNYGNVSRTAQAYVSYLYNHTYGSWTVVTPASCTEDGVEMHRCSGCYKEETRSIPFTGHVWKEEYTVDTEATCIDDGSESRHCSVCDEIMEGSERVINKTGIHKYGDWNTTKSPTCTETGSKERICSVCEGKDEETIPAKGHKWVDGKTITYPTRTKEGVKEQTCSVCQAKRQAAIPAATDSSLIITPKKITISNYADFVNGGLIDCEASGEFPGMKYRITPTKGSKIVKASTSNKNVIKLYRDEEYVDDYGLFYDFEPVGVGSAVITCEDIYQNKDTCTITVTNSYMADYIDDYTSVQAVKSGGYIKGKTLSGAAISSKVGGKTYSVKANKSGKFSIKIPIVKVGTKISITIKYNNGTKTYTRKIAKPGVSISTPTIYRTTKTIKVTAKNVHKGDKISIKVGKKTYTKKIKKDATKVTYKQKIKKTKEGSKITITVKNKFKQTVYSGSKKVYYASKIKKGMTKKQCKLVPGWEHPDDKYVSGSWETWWYDDDGDGYANESYLQFYKGKLYGWHY